MKLTILGTGNAMVTECYNTCFALQENEECFLVDGGGGNTILARLKQADIDWRTIKNIFVTHKHLDHIMGIIWMLRLICQGISRGEADTEVNIYGHDEVIALLDAMAHALIQEKHVQQIGPKVHLIPVADGETVAIMGHDVTFFDIHSTKAKQFGFSMMLDGGRKLTCCGDEPYNDCEYPYAQNSTWLMHEAFCLHSQANRFKPYEKHHSTVRDACLLAEQLHVKNLILYHTEDKNILHRKELYLAEGRPLYLGNLYVPNDLETFIL